VQKGHQWHDIINVYTVEQIKFFYTEICIQEAELRAVTIENVLLGAQGTSEIVTKTVDTFRKIRSEV
jgi:hypothetical protein